MHRPVPLGLGSNGASAGTATTELSVVGVNFPWCFNDAVELLRTEPGVVAVAASISGQCTRIEHGGVPIDELIAAVMAGRSTDDHRTTDV